MNAYLAAALSIFTLAHVFFLFSAKNRRNDYADIMWGLAFLAAIIGGLMVTHRYILAVEWIPLICVGFWAIRLAWHIGTRVFSHKTEDQRYLKMRQDWGSRWLINTYLKVFILQSVLAFIMALPLLHWIVNGFQGTEFTLFGGLILWLIGFIFESVSDKQLKEFRSHTRNKGKIMDQGLWRYSRHPNYFGEVTQWWGIFLITFDSSALYLIVSPLLITFLIIKVSGVSMMEKIMKDRPGFAEYAKRTSVFFPLPPRPKNSIS